MSQFVSIHSVYRHKKGEVYILPKGEIFYGYLYSKDACENQIKEYVGFTAPSSLFLLVLESGWSETKFLVGEKVYYYIRPPKHNFVK